MQVYHRNKSALQASICATTLFPSQFTKISSRCSLISRAPDFAIAIHIICIHRLTLHSAAS